MKIEILNRWSGAVLFSIETENWRLAVEAAIKRGADLRDVNLRGVDLRDVDLRGANLCGANLRGANLCDANLCDANLCDANLCDANLCGANLCDANLCGANLCGANLCDAYLRGADLGNAKNLVRFPIQVLGHKHFLQTTQDGQLQIGCHVHTFDEWREQCQAIGKENGYSEMDVEIYKLHIEHIEKISKLLWKEK